MRSGFNSALQAVSLLRHPASPALAVTGVSAWIGLSAATGMQLTYRIEGAITALRIPAAGPPGPADRLWEHTCCEAFLGPADRDPYHEFNFSPSGHWAAYAFRGYRARGPRDPILEPRITFRTGPTHLEVRAQIAPAALPEPDAGGAYRLALAAVLEGADGTRAYWALHHPPGAPDFHHPDAFALRVTGDDRTDLRVRSPGVLP